MQILSLQVQVSVADDANLPSISLFGYSLLFASCKTELYPVVHPGRVGTQLAFKQYQKDAV